MSVRDDFYGGIVDDFLMDRENSVIYQYYYDVFTSKKETSNPKKKETSNPWTEFKSLGDKPSKEELRKFVVKLLKVMTKKTNMYHYQDKTKDSREDFLTIYNAVRPFIISDRDNIEELVYKLKNETDISMSTNSILGKRLSKNKLNSALKSSIKQIETMSIDIDIMDIKELVSHVRDRMIFKAIDDFLYTAGYHIILSRENEQEYENGFALREENEQESKNRFALGEEKGREVRKSDKILELVHKYYNKFGELPFKERDLSDPEYFEICEKLHDYLEDVSNVSKGNNIISIPLTVDTFTGCSLQLVGDYYYDRKTVDRSFAYAVMGRLTDTKEYHYEYYDEETLIFEDLDTAVIEYKSKTSNVRDDITSKNWECISCNIGERKLSDLPLMFRHFFGDDFEIEKKEEEEEELKKDTMEHIRRPYDDEKGDPEYVNMFGVN